MEVVINHDSFKANPHTGLSLSNSFNVILVKYGTTRYYKLYEGFKSPSLQNNYLIEFVGCESAMKAELLQTGFFSRIRTNSDFLNDSTGCASSALTVNDPYTSFTPRPSTLPAANIKFAAEMIQSQCAWGLTEGDPNITVAIIDTEFDTNHVELKGRFKAIYSFVDYTHQYHGKQVSGGLAANVNNNSGVAGIGNKITMVGYKITNYFDFRGVNAVVMAYNHGHKIISVSYQGSGSLDSAVVRELTDNGVTLVFCAGNAAPSTTSAQPHYGNAYIPGFIIVGSHNYEGKVQPPNHSLYPEVDIVAPGKDVLTSAGGPDYFCTNSSWNYCIDEICESLSYTCSDRRNIEVKCIFHSRCELCSYIWLYRWKA